MKFSTKTKRELTFADYEQLGASALSTFETVAVDLEVASIGLAEQHALAQNEIDALMIHQAAIKESQAKFSKAAAKVRALIS